jgi:quercetin dioxygenase-like cupin family protein
LVPLSDDRNPFEVLIPKLKAASEQFDLVPLPHHPPFDPQQWPADGDNALPDAVQPYFLRSGSGPKYILGSTLCRPLITRTQSAGKFSIASIEGSSHYTSPLQQHKSITFRDVHHCVHVSDGYVDFTVEGSRTRLAVGETLYIPSGTPFSFQFASKLAKAYFFCNGGGLSELLCRAGREYTPPLIPGKEMESDASELSRFEKELRYMLS